MTDFPVYPVAKKCYECGTEWDGNAFTPQPAGVPRLPGICADCIAKDEAILRASMVVQVEPPRDIELAPPQSVANADDDVLPIDRKMLAAGEREPGES